ncbi:DNA-binding response regulator [Paenibacillus baekrokdamisoli]|uniref:Heme response regulator HssR n=1 Tax=Paenibacillus baekrokdamisoli TaxID=1712516 RepID=A0A3G9JH67_9BACL|nr:response regulator transcription factor [Paenibacillus baekrokdamisoli]MBB3068517.1 DNA-binding response OmpR family regulator [Paenibacillus baekrokdamisoli]BBH22444.1 DNA-binding response regulator [Paenibacillus baekrokdamisoli]
MATILIADDDARIRELMSLFLRNEGFELVEATNGSEALSIIEDSRIDLVILDIMMPVMNGWDLCREIRQRDSNIPLLMVTVKAEAAQKVKGFQLGTDDYLTKPFDPMELVMRVKALLKRSMIVSSQTVQLGGIMLNRRSYQVIRGDEVLNLPLKEFELLFLLASHPGQIFTREQLITQIWGMNYEGDDRTVDVHIKRIREKFVADTQHFQIEAARSLGYRLVTP